MSFFRDLEEECKPQKILAPEFSSHGTTDAKKVKNVKYFYSRFKGLFLDLLLKTKTTFN